MKRYVENLLIDLLNLLRRYDIVDFEALTPADQENFKREFTQTVTQICHTVAESCR